MTAALVVLTPRRITVCCPDHMRAADDVLSTCCDRENCWPCCPECPTCPLNAAAEADRPGWGRRAAEDVRRWKAEVRGDRLALVEIGTAMWFYDRSDYLRFVVHPPVVGAVFASRAVSRAIWDEVFA